MAAHRVSSTCCRCEIVHQTLVPSVLLRWTGRCPLHLYQILFLHGLLLIPPSACAPAGSPAAAWVTAAISSAATSTDYRAFAGSTYLTSSAYSSSFRVDSADVRGAHAVTRCLLYILESFALLLGVYYLLCYT